MSRATEIYAGIKHSPFAILEFIWGVALIADGVYLLWPSYEAKTGSVLIEFINEPLVSTSLAIFYIITGIIASASALLGKSRWRNLSTIMLFMAFFFTALIRVLTVGLVPTVWVWPALLAVTAAVDNWNINWNRRAP